MSKNWRENGFYTDYSADHDTQINTSINQGEVLLTCAEKIISGDVLTDQERYFASTVLSGIGQDMIRNPEKRIIKNDNGRKSNPYRFEILSFYFSCLRVLGAKNKARFCAACHWEFTVQTDETAEEKIYRLQENIRSWEREDEIDNKIKAKSDAGLIANPEAIVAEYERYKKIWKK